MVTDVPQNQPCPHCGRWHARATTVDAVIEDEKGRILLVKRKEPPFAGLWALPGGYLDDDETLPKAAIREVLEETGIRGSSPRLIGIFDNPNRHPEQAISVAYALVPGPGGVARVADAREIAEVRWCPIDRLPPLAFDHSRIIAVYRGNR